MKKQKKSALLVLLCLVLFLFPAAVRAKTTVPEDPSLKNVAKAETLNGKWVKKGSNFRFRKKDGTYKKDGWFKTNGRIYCADSKGNRIKGWVKYRDHLYYLDAGGVLKSGWVQIKKNTYFFALKNYRLRKEAWIRTNGKYYYVDKKGRKCGPGWHKILGKKYYFDEDGARMTGTLYLGNEGYYFDEDGVYDPSVKVEPEVDLNKPMVALTFDDGPSQYTSRLLDCLQKNDAKATFFMVGSSVPSYQSTVKRMADMGCELGAHSYSHTSFTSLSSAGIASEVSRTVANIKAAAGRGPTVFRLPYGNGHSNSSVLSALGLPSIYWSIDTMDWANTKNSAHTVNEVLNHVQSGDIVLMHDIHYATIVAAEQIIPALKKRGYQLVTVSQLAKYKGNTTLYAGRTYYHFR